MLRGFLIALAVASLGALGGCDDAPPGRPPDPPGVRVDQRMGTTPDPGFERAIQPRAFEFPRDHGAHPGFATEWWYFTGNLQSDNGARFGYQLTLFRIGLKPGPPARDSAWRATQMYMGHLAISDIGARRHHTAERFSRAAAGLAGAESTPLRVWLGPWSIRGAGSGLFPLHISAQTDEIAIDLSLAQGAKPLVVQGEHGLSRKAAAAGNASYYYSYTRLPTSGEIRIGDRRRRVAGNSWFDREWSSSALAADQAGWDWFALQLDDGRDLMIYRMRGKDGRAQAFSSGVLVGTDGAVQTLAVDDFRLVQTRTWRNADGVDYPVGWRVTVARLGLDLDVEAAFDAQEMRHAVHYWEGAVAVSGSHTGVGYLEASGYAR
ncbi:MAG: carotenoid 1,2-hydratase [Chromatiaceae bacterium]|nr:carotenoid 1,2-hydratase [Chromatiaceae bacterium]